MYGLRWEFQVVYMHSSQIGHYLLENIYEDGDEGSFERRKWQKDSYQNQGEYEREYTILQNNNDID